MQNNLGLLIHEAIKKIYPEINGGYTFRENENDFDNALFWESTEYLKPTLEQIEKVLPIVELEYSKTQKHHELIEAYNIAISKPHPIFNAPKLDKLNKPIGFTDAEFLIKDPSILKQETTIVFGGLFLTILRYFELLNSNLLTLFNKLDQDLLKLKQDLLKLKIDLKLDNITPEKNPVPENLEAIKKAFTHTETMMTALKSAIPIPYLTKNKEGEEVKIALTGAENFSIFKHLFERVQKQSSLLDNLKNEIENAENLEQLNKININF